VSVLKRVRDIVLWLMHLPPFVFSLTSVVGIFYEEGGGGAAAAAAAANAKPLPKVFIL